MHLFILNVGKNTHPVERQIFGSTDEPEQISPTDEPEH